MTVCSIVFYVVNIVKLISYTWRDIPKLFVMACLRGMGLFVGRCSEMMRVREFSHCLDLE